MAEPQVENGYTRIANEILDALILHRMSGREWQVVLFIIRETYGFNKKADDISIGQMSAETGLSRRNIAAILKRLFAKKIIATFCI